MKDQNQLIEYIKLHAVTCFEFCGHKHSNGKECASIVDRETGFTLLTVDGVITENGHLFLDEHLGS